MDSILSQPVTSAPPGHIQNLEHPPSQAYLIIATIAICLTCTTIVVLTRMYVTLCITRNPKWDDGLVLFSWLGYIAYSVLSLVTIKYGTLIDIWNVRIGQILQWVQLMYIIELMYQILIFGTKISILLLYKRAFVPIRASKTWVSHSITFVIIFNVLLYFASLFVVAFNCTPHAKIFNPLIPGHCVDLYAFFMTTGVLNMVSDIFIILIPITVIWKLQLSQRRKVETLFVFGFGVLCLASSIGRLIYSVFDVRDANATVANVKTGLWTFGEITSCFLASCAPMVPKLIRHLLGNSTDTEARTHITPVYQRKKQSGQASCALNRWSDTESHGERHTSIEDPYRLSDELSSQAGMEMHHQPHKENHIVVSRTVSIMSIPRAHTPPV